MREKLVVALLLCGWAARSPAQGSLRYATQLEDWREMAHRLELRTPDWRLLAVERGAGLAPEYLAFGLACPWGALGPLEPRGLLRELADPLGYSPGSGIFGEDAGLRLDGSLEGASRRGLWLEPLPGSLGLFALVVPEERGTPGGIRDTGLWGPLEMAGGTGRIRWPATGSPSGRVSPAGFLEAEALAVISAPAAAPPSAGEQDWLDGLPPFPGGKLAHLAGRLRLEETADAGGLACCLLGAASGGERVPPGLFGLWVIEASGAAWSAHGLLGASSPDYRTPEGRLYAGSRAAGLRLEIRPRPVWWLSGTWRRKIDRPPPVPERNLPGSEEGELALRLEVPLPEGGRFELQADAGARARYAADGGVEPSVSGGLEAGIRGKQDGLGLELRGSWREGCGELRGLFRGQHGSVRLLVGAEGALSPIRENSGFFPFGRLELSGKAMLFWMSAEDGKDGMSLSLGWSVAQALPASPTSRTSRSRR